MKLGNILAALYAGFAISHGASAIPSINVSNSDKPLTLDSTVTNSVPNIAAVEQKNRQSISFHDWVSSWVVRSAEYKASVENGPGANGASPAAPNLGNQTASTIPDLPHVNVTSPLIPVPLATGQAAGILTMNYVHLGSNPLTNDILTSRAYRSLFVNVLEDPKAQAPPITYVSSSDIAANQKALSDAGSFTLVTSGNPVIYSRALLPTTLDTKVAAVQSPAVLSSMPSNLFISVSNQYWRVDESVQYQDINFDGNPDRIRFNFGVYNLGPDARYNIYQWKFNGGTLSNAFNLSQESGWTNIVSISQIDWNYNNGNGSVIVTNTSGTFGFTIPYTADTYLSSNGFANAWAGGGGGLDTPYELPQLNGFVIPVPEPNARTLIILSLAAGAVFGRRRLYSGSKLDDEIRKQL